MRLLHVERLEFAYFSDDKIPKYVIASHRWYPDAEATFQDVRNRQDTDKAGYQKIKAFAKYIKDNCPQIEWLWIDTCCINKDSAAELSEAINLMFKWYSNAEVCLAYLADVDKKADFGRSEWFKRGWTLQELLAPRTVLFLSKGWEVVGHKGTDRIQYADMSVGPGLEDEISSITGIPEEVLHDYGASRSINNDEKLKWMHGRVTTRPEDMSYALYGICGVTPGANYGEEYDGARQRLLAAINYQEDLAAQQAEKYRKIVDWLSPCDPWTNHQTARSRHEPQTGSWLIETDDYRAWKSDAVRHLWVHGKAGCGKTVVCSLAIEDVRAHCAGVAGTGSAIFYFSFSDERKRKYEDLLLSLVAQVGSGEPSLATTVKKSQECGCNKPGPDELENILKSCIRSYKQFYLVIDAFDESPEDNDVRQNLLTRLSHLAEQLPHLKILATSRELPDIRTFMARINAKSLPVPTRCVDADIRRYVAAEILRDHRLSRLDQTTQSLIEETLSERADGMFRWAFCQLQELKKLKLAKPSLVQQALFSLPKTLDETYERMLTGIDQHLRGEALTLLRWLAYARAPLSLAEIAETTIVDLTEEGTVHVDDRPGIYDALELLAGLVCEEVSLENSDDNVLWKYEWLALLEDDTDFQLDRSHIRKETRIRLAHFSVKEYLESGRILESSAKEFHLVSGREHSVLCQSCLVYLWYCHELPAEVRPDARDFDMLIRRQLHATLPLVRYAAESWYYHASLQHVGEFTREVRLLETEAALHFWLSWHQPDGTLRHEPFNPGGLYYASHLGLESVVVELLANGEDCNAKGGKHMHALGAASFAGYDRIVQLLLEAGTSLDCQSTALSKASKQGHEKVVRLLLNAEANSQAPEARYDKSDALYEVVSSGREHIVEMLIDAGASANAVGRDGGCALYAATASGHERIVEILLHAGADTQGPTGRMNGRSNALYVASKFRFEGIVRMLLNAGADPNALGGDLGDSSALYAAVQSDNEKTVQMLLNGGADANAPGGKWASSALLTAVSNKNERIVEMLLSAGADANSREEGPREGSALSIATRTGNKRIVRMLLDAGAQTDLLAWLNASRWSNDTMVRLLIQAAIPADTTEEYHRRALLEASIKGHEKIVRALLEAGADVNSKHDGQSSALFLAQERGHDAVVQVLLDAGANTHDLGMSGFYEDHEAARETKRKRQSVSESMPSKSGRYEAHRPWKEVDSDDGSESSSDALDSLNRDHWIGFSNEEKEHERPAWAERRTRQSPSP